MKSRYIVFSYPKFIALGVGILVLLGTVVYIAEYYSALQVRERIITAQTKARLEQEQQRKIALTPYPTLDVRNHRNFRTLSVTQGNCPKNTNFIETDSLSFCSPEGWAARLYTDFEERYGVSAQSVEISYGNDRITFEEYGHVEVPEGGGQQKSQKITIDGYRSFRVTDATQENTKLIVLYRASHAEDYSGYFITNNSKYIDNEQTAFDLVERTFHIKQWHKSNFDK